MSNRALLTTEDNSGAPAPLEPGSLVAGPTPGYWRFAVVALSGVSTWGASFVAAANAAAAKVFLALTKSDVGLSNVDNTSDVNKPVSTAQATADGLRVLKAGDTMTGDLTIGSGKNLKLTGGAGAGQGCIVFGAAASTFWDSNVCIVDSSAKTMGYVCGTTAAFTGSSGPFFGLRGNTFAAQPTQRGNIFLFGGKPSTPGANEGRVIFGTNDTERMYITYAGLVVMANATISDLPAGRVVVTTTGGRCASDAGLTWASSTLGATQLQVGSGTAITKIVVYTPSLTPASVAAGAPSEQTFAVAGLATADTVTVNAPGAAVFSARVSAADTLALTFMPPAAGSYTPPAGTYRILAHRS